jgi:hypothetical protein
MSASVIAVPARAAASKLGPPELEIAIPVYNERLALEGSIRRLHGFLSTSLPLSWRIVIADLRGVARLWRSRAVRRPPLGTSSRPVLVP